MTLGEFLGSLSELTRSRWELAGYDLAEARSMCDTIARYDKLRLVAEREGRIEALLELSFGIPAADVVRFASHGVVIDERTDCRFGPCVRDEARGTGLGSACLAATLGLARRFAKHRVLLWGGVLAYNTPATAFYRRHRLCRAAPLRRTRRPSPPGHDPRAGPRPRLRGSTAWPPRAGAPALDQLPHRPAPPPPLAWAWVHRPPLRAPSPR